MDNGHAEITSADAGAGNSAPRRLFEDHPIDRHQILLLPVALRHSRADVRHHHLPNLHPTSFQQALASATW
jgi:hypothetical protein